MSFGDNFLVHLALIVVFPYTLISVERPKIMNNHRLWPRPSQRGLGTALALVPFPGTQESLSLSGTIFLLLKKELV